MNSDAIGLTVKFLSEVKGYPMNSQKKVAAPANYKKIVMESFDQLLQSGNSVSLMSQMISEYIRRCETYKEAYKMEDIFHFLNINIIHNKLPEKNPENILEPLRFYHHPALQVAPPAPIVELLPDGTFRSSYDEEEFFLEIKESFTIDDLVDYFYRMTGNDNSRYRDRDKGAFKHMLRQTDLDALLYAIDDSTVGDEFPRMPFDIEKYIKNAELILEERKSSLSMEGLDHVIPRPR
jgi:hypothetical protein